MWARTVKSPDPAFAQVDVPLASTFLLATKAGKEAYIKPVIDTDGYGFKIEMGIPKDAKTARDGTKLSRGANFKCVMSGTPITGDYIKAEGKAGRMGVRLMAIVTEGERGRIYLPPTEPMERIAQQAKPEWRPDVAISGSTQYLGVKPYGMEQFSQLFTDRQLVTLTTFSDLVQEARRRVELDALDAGLADDKMSLTYGGCGATAYADAVTTFLAFGVDRIANYCSSVCTWHSGIKYETVTSTFGRQAIPMT